MGTSVRIVPEKVERHPALCPGSKDVPAHPYKAGEVVVGWKPCTCQTWVQPAGHRTYWCQFPQCGAVVHVPACTQESRAAWDNGLTPPDRMGGL